MNPITSDEMKKWREWISKYLDGNKDFVTAWLSDVPDFICDQIDDTLTPERLKQLAEEDDRTVIEPTDSASQIGSLGRKLSVIYNYFKKFESKKIATEANKASKPSSSKRKAEDEKQTVETKAKLHKETTCNAKASNKKSKAFVSSTKPTVTPLERYRASQSRQVLSSHSSKQSAKLFDTDQLSICLLANEKKKECIRSAGNSATLVKADVEQPGSEGLSHTHLYFKIESTDFGTQPFEVTCESRRFNNVAEKNRNQEIKACKESLVQQKKGVPNVKEPKKRGRVIFLPSSCMKTMISNFAPDLADQQDIMDTAQAASIIYLEKVIRKAEELATKSGRDYVTSKDMNEVYKIEYGSKMCKSKLAKVLDSINC